MCVRWTVPISGHPVHAIEVALWLHSAPTRGGYAVEEFFLRGYQHPRPGRTLDVAHPRKGETDKRLPVLVRHQKGTLFTNHNALQMQ